MARGDDQKSPIVKALAATERTCGCEIRVYLTRRWIERDPFGRALRLFFSLDMDQGEGRAILFYVNTRRRKFAIVVGRALRSEIDSSYWEKLNRQLREDLLSTHPENAIAMAIVSTGQSLRAIKRR